MMSGFSDVFLAVFASMGIIILILIFLYYSRLWEALRDLFFKKEDYLAEIQNVYYHANTYRRKVERAKEILTVACLVHQNPARDPGGLQIPASYLPLVINQPNNIYSVLEKVFEKIMDAEDELLDNIKLANDKIRNFNIYIQSPVFPGMVARREGMIPVNYEGIRLVEIENHLNQGLAQISLLEEDILNLLRAHGGTMPSNEDLNRENRSDDDISETLDINRDNSGEDDKLDFEEGEKR